MAEDVVLIQVGKRGALTLPKGLRDKYGIRPGDALTLLDLGGAFVLIPKVSMVDRLADRIAQRLREKGVTLEEMLEELRRERERYYEERYAQKVPGVS